MLHEKAQSLWSTVTWQRSCNHTKHTVVLHARDDARRSSSGDCTELSSRQWCRSVAQVALGVRTWRCVRYGAMLQSLLKRRFGEHDDRRDISKYEQQSSDLISDAIKHGIVCGDMAHPGLKQHIDFEYQSTVNIQGTS